MRTHSEDRRTGSRLPAAAFRSALVTQAMLALAVAAMAVMAGYSRVDSHPDEEFHARSASYYVDHWLPPRADDPAMVAYLHGFYGVSHLLVFPPQITYLVAAKCVWPLVRAGTSFAHGLRVFQLALFLALAVTVAVRRRLDPVYSFFLLLTPQLWYVFSYFNGDAFAFFTAFLVALLLGDPKSSAARFLRADETGGHRGGGVAIGALAGMLLLCKKNYWLFLAFLIAYGLWTAMASDPARRWRILRRWAAVGGIAVVLAGPIIVCDAARNGFDKTGKGMALREVHARDGFKPSQRGGAEGYPTVSLKAKGVPLRELFRKWRWHEWSFRSFTGVYGYMTIMGPPGYYRLQKLLYAALGITAGAIMLRRVTRRTWPILLLGTLFAALAVVQSVYHSWSYDFQAQGRYLFPAIPILMLTWRAVMGPRQARALRWLALPAFVLGLYSFVGVGLVCIDKAGVP